VYRVRYGTLSPTAVTVKLTDSKLVSDCRRLPTPLYGPSRTLARKASDSERWAGPVQRPEESIYKMRDTRVSVFCL